MVILVAILAFSIGKADSSKSDLSKETNDTEYVLSDLEIEGEAELSVDDLFRKNRFKNLPDEAIKTLFHIRKFNKAPNGYVGGRQFMNRERRLPHTENGQTIFYREWDIYPKVKGQNRGAKRLVTSLKKAYYTSDHYSSFTEIIE